MISSSAVPSSERGSAAVRARSLSDLFAWVRQQVAQHTPAARVTVAFCTMQQSQHQGRQSGYANHVVSLRVGQSVGSCFVEPGQLDSAAVDACVGKTVAELLSHPLAAIRIAALDAYLGEIYPHALMSNVRMVTVPAGDSTAKSLFRARAVVDLLATRPGQRVALIGVVNSLIQTLRERDLRCLPCDFNTRMTEWGDPVTAHMAEVLESADAILATGMTLANGSFDQILAYARRQGIPLVVFAQTGSAIIPRFVGAGVTGVSAEPYPFFWLSGAATPLYLYRSQSTTDSAQELAQ